jgi:Secretion system C-terminal sorting domain
MKSVSRIPGVKMKILVLLLFLTCRPGLLAQQVISTAGNTFSNSTGSISFTIGESVSQTLIKGDKILTQGFVQGTVSASAISEMQDSEYSFSVFPNPTHNELTLKINKGKIIGLQYLLYDINGKVISQKSLNDAVTNVPLELLPLGIYIIKIQTDTKDLQTFKIVKK